MKRHENNESVYVRTRTIIEMWPESEGRFSYYAYPNHETGFSCIRWQIENNYGIFSDVADIGNEKVDMKLRNWWFRSPGMSAAVERAKNLGKPAQSELSGGDLMIKILKCLRCGHEWPTKAADRVRVCPRCHSPYWDKPRKAKAN